MGNYAGGIFKIVGFVLFSIVITVSLMRLSAVIFPPVQEPSAAYDCDDETLDMYYYFQKLGIESTPIVGNLDMTGEAYMESNHVWLLVKSSDKEIAYDWGTPCFDRQHYEGYAISLDYLLYAVNQDKEGKDSLPIAKY
jgi:hypothetical protein